jgi:hypothetical protein
VEENHIKRNVLPIRHQVERSLELQRNIIAGIDEEQEAALTITRCVRTFGSMYKVAKMSLVADAVIEMVREQKAVAEIAAAAAAKEEEERAEEAQQKVAGEEQRAAEARRASIMKAASGAATYSSPKREKSTKKPRKSEPLAMLAPPPKEASAAGEAAELAQVSFDQVTAGEPAAGSDGGVPLGRGPDDGKLPRESTTSASMVELNLAANRPAPVLTVKPGSKGDADADADADAEGADAPLVSKVRRMSREQVADLEAGPAKMSNKTMFTKKKEFLGRASVYSAITTVSGWLEKYSSGLVKRWVRRCVACCLFVLVALPRARARTGRPLLVLPAEAASCAASCRRCVLCFCRTKKALHADGCPAPCNGREMPRGPVY